MPVKFDYWRYQGEPAKSPSPHWVWGEASIWWIKDKDAPPDSGVLVSAKNEMAAIAAGGKQLIKQGSPETAAFFAEIVVPFPQGAEVAIKIEQGVPDGQIIGASK